MCECVDYDVIRDLFPKGTTDQEISDSGILFKAAWEDDEKDDEEHGGNIILDFLQEILENNAQMTALQSSAIVLSILAY